MVNKYGMKPISQIKGEAWVMLSGNWGPAIGVVLLAGVIMWGAGMVLSMVTQMFSFIFMVPIGVIASGSVEAMSVFMVLFWVLFIMVISLGLSMASKAFEGVLERGKASYFLQLSRGSQRPEFSVMFDGFSDFLRSALTGLLYGLYVWLWSLLLIVPGIVFSIAYSQAYFILRDHPGINAGEALRRSREMMRGAKAKYFWMWLSFMGWWLLILISFGIASIWAAPYWLAARTKFYADLVANQYSETAHITAEAG